MVPGPRARGSMAPKVDELILFWAKEEMLNERSKIQIEILVYILFEF